MSQKLLQVNLKFSISRADLEAAWLGVAQPIADTPGLRWKVWLMNEAEREAGGIYLFDSEEAAQAYMGGPIVAALKGSPAVSDISKTVTIAFLQRRAQFCSRNYEADAAQSRAVERQ